MISKKGTTKIVDFITSKAGGSEAWLNCLYSENALFTLKSLLWSYTRQTEYIIMSEDGSTKYKCHNSKVREFRVARM